MARSSVAGQRVAALQLLAAVLDTGTGTLVPRERAMTHRASNEHVSAVDA